MEIEKYYHSENTGNIFQITEVFQMLRFYFKCFCYLHYFFRTVYALENLALSYKTYIYNILLLEDICPWVFLPNQHSRWFRSKSLALHQLLRNGQWRPQLGHHRLQVYGKN